MIFKTQVTAHSLSWAFCWHVYVCVLGGNIKCISSMGHIPKVWKPPFYRTILQVFEGSRPIPLPKDMGPLQPLQYLLVGWGFFPSLFWASSSGPVTRFIWVSPQTLRDVFLNHSLLQDTTPLSPARHRLMFLNAFFTTQPHILYVFVCLWSSYRTFIIESPIYFLAHSSCSITFVEWMDARGRHILVIVHIDVFIIQLFFLSHNSIRI